MRWIPSPLGGGGNASLSGCGNWSFGVALSHSGVIIAGVPSLWDMSTTFPLWMGFNFGNDGMPFANFVWPLILIIVIVD
jgi:hypothetical protein